MLILALLEVNDVPGMEHGFERAVSEVLIGFALSAFTTSLANSGLIPSPYLLTFKLLVLAGAIPFIYALPYWGTGYILGWLLGYAVMLPSGIVDPLDFVIFTAIPLIILCLRFFKEVQG